MSLLSPQSPPSYLAMPSTRLTTRVQRRAEAFAPRRRNARGNAMASSEKTDQHHYRQQYQLLQSLASPASYYPPQ